MQSSFVLCFAIHFTLCSGSTVFGDILNSCRHVEKYDGIIQCDQEMVYIMLGHCMSDNLIAGCLYVNQKVNIINRVYYQLPPNASEGNEDQCKPYNRKGLFCGECIEEFGPSVDFYSVDCKDCSNYSILNTIAYYLLSQVLPITSSFHKSSLQFSCSNLC